MKQKNRNFYNLCCTIAQLRSDTGCPWDQKQDSQSLKKYIREECDELLEAMEGDSSQHLCEEIGDLLFLLILLSKINEESNEFTIDDVLRGINEKMIRRHPHVFSGAESGDEEFLRKQWEKIKSKEKMKK